MAFSFSAGIGGASVNINGNGVSIQIPGLPGISTPAAPSNSFNINNFIQNLGQHNETARSDKFDVYITPPAAVSSYAGLSPAYAVQGFSLQCDTSELPSRDIQVTEYVTHAFIRRVPHLNQFGVANFTFICSGDMWEKKFFDSWLDFMIPVNTGLINYPLDPNNNRNYEADIACNQYDMAGNLIYSAQLQDAMPVNMSALNQSWDNDSIHKLNVTFQFRRWVSDQTTYNQTTTFGGVNPNVLPTSGSGQISTSPTAPSLPTDQRIPSLIST